MTGLPFGAAIAKFVSASEALSRRISLVALNKFMGSAATEESITAEHFEISNTSRYSSAVRGHIFRRRSKRARRSVSPWSRSGVPDFGTGGALATVVVAPGGEEAALLAFLAAFL